jgi:hypothetical protein
MPYIRVDGMNMLLLQPKLPHHNTIYSSPDLSPCQMSSFPSVTPSCNAFTRISIASLLESTDIEGTQGSHARTSKTGTDVQFEEGQHSEVVNYIQPPTSDQAQEGMLAMYEDKNPSCLASNTSLVALSIEPQTSDHPR